jgi:hypothetical protein
MMIESTACCAVHTQTLYLRAGSLLVLGRYCIIIGSCCCIFTAKDITMIFFAILVSVIVVVVARLLLLSRASDAGDTGLYTMELLELTGSVSHRQKMIKLGEKKGYFKGVRKIKPGRKGNIW